MRHLFSSPGFHGAAVNLRMLFADDVVLLTTSMHSDGLRLNVEWLGWAAASPSLMLSARNCWFAPSELVGESLPQAKQFLRVVFTCDRQMEHEMDGQFCAASAVMWTIVVEREPRLESKALNLKVQLSSTVSWVFVNDWKNEITDVSSRAQP